MPARIDYLAQPDFFPDRFRHAGRVFAELPAGLDTVHRTMFDPGKKSLVCTCPFFPKPCVHALALAALYAREGESGFALLPDLPEWALALSNGHLLAARQRGASAEQREAAREERRSDRLERAEQGFGDLEAWLSDTLRRGVATAVSEDPQFYQNIAARLADASMRGLSRNLRLLEAVPVSAPDWSERVVGVLVEAALALRAFRKRDELPEPLCFDLEAFIGIAIKKEIVLAQGESLRDVWAVLSVVEETVEAKLRSRRTWMLGARSGRFALLLDYAHGDPDFPPGFAPGTLQDGDLVFYPSAFPQRALIPGDLNLLPKKVEKLPGFDSLDEMAGAHARALGAQPWLTHFPAVLTKVLPFYQNGRFGLADEAGKCLFLAEAGTNGWPLIALAGGRPLPVFGEWDGAVFRVLSVVAEGRFVTL